MKIRTALLAVALATGALLVGASPAAADVEAQAGIGTYNITFRTGDLPNADTDDHVRVTFFGDLKKSPPVQIDRDFRRNETITFGPYRWETIGRPGWISLGKSGSQNDAWYPEYVQLYDQHNGALYTCPVHEWFPQGSLTRYYSCS